MISFLSRLTVVLTKEDPEWRSNSVILLDGASYHKSTDVKLLLKRLGVTYIVSGPYSYDAAPIELLFSYFKRGYLNPSNEPTGKK
jgi:transposase